MHALGILTLDTRFARIYGDAGNPATWPFPVRTLVVSGASPERVVRDRADGLIDAFIAGAHRLADEGVAGITTTCGFLCLHQVRIAAALPVPFASSSLLQVPMVARVLPGGRRVGILTIDQSSLTADHLRAVGIEASTPVEGVPADGHLAQVFVDSTAELDTLEARRELVEAGKRLLALHAGVGAIVLECANMPPYASALHAELGVPVYDWYSMVSWFARGLQPRTFIASAARLDSAASGRPR